MEELFHKYYQQLKYYGLKFIEDHQVVEDIVMDVFINFNGEGYKDERQTLYLFVKRRCLDYLKTQKVHLNAEKEIALNVDHAIIESEVLINVNEALSKISPEARKIVEMYYLEEKRCTEIAKELGKPESTIRSLKRYALNCLSKIIKPQI